MFHQSRFALAAVLSLAAPLTFLLGQKTFTLTIDNIMRGPNLIGYEPADPRWSGDDQRIYFQWKQASDPVLKPTDTYVIERDGSGLRKLSDDESREAPPALGDTSKDKKLTVFARDGDIFVYDRSSDKVRQLTKTADIESNPHVTRDGKRIYFTRATNLYLMALDTGMLEEMTDIRAANVGGPATPPPAGFGLGQGRGQQQSGQATTTATGEQQRGTDSQEFLKKEQRDLLDVVRQRAQRREEEEARHKRENPRKPFTLLARQNVTSLTLSPDEKTVLATVSEPGQGAKNTIVPNFVTESTYVENIPGRTNVGDAPTRIRMALIDARTGEVKWVDHGQRGTEQQVDKTQDQPVESQDQQGEAPRKPRQPLDRDVQLLQPVWSEDGTKAVMLARASDNKDRWILALDPATGKTRVIASDHDNAWLDGPGANALGWMKTDREVYFQSERTGYSHLYTVSYDGGEPRALTSGKWEVLSARLSEDKSTFYLTTNEGDPAIVQIYSLPAEGGERTRVTTLPGNHRPMLSHDERWIADIHSSANKPPELYVMENRPGAEEKS